MKALFLFGAASVAVLLAACSPPPVPAAKSVPQPVSAVPAPVPTSVPPPASVRPVPLAAVRMFDESLLTGREFLWEASSSKVEVRDLDLGVLNTNPELVAAVVGFLRGAWGGTLDADRLAPRWSSYLKGWAKRMQSDGTFVSARVGVERKSDATFVPVKITTNTKVWLGWVVLERGAAGWLVNDVQVEESAARTEPFDPESQPTLLDQEISSPNRR